MNDALSGLSPYQRAAVRHLEDLYLNRGRSVYLVAGEVGLGKTFIAKALIQRLGARRVIYIASNAEIARANVDELTDRGRSGQTVSADRLSMFRPDALTPPEALWVYPLSPATTFTNLGSPTGRADERAFFRAAFQRRPALFQDYLRFLEAQKKACGGRFPLSGKLSEKTPDDTLPPPSPDGWSVQQQAALALEFPYLRKFFNDLAVASFQPDLLILDEFHRFHSLLAPPSGGPAYSMAAMLERLNAMRLEAGRPPVRVLLLSATPYHMQLLEKEVRTYTSARGEAQEASDPDRAFENFTVLKSYIHALDRLGRKGSALSPPPREDNFDGLYETLMCRTERNWLLAGLPPVPLRDLGAVPQPNGDLHAASTPMVPHLRYRLDYQASLPAGFPYAPLQTYLDEAPEFLQFADGYGDICGKANDSIERIREHLCALLSDGARIRPVPSGEPDPSFSQATAGHCKWDLLRRCAMPPGCELLLWVPLPSSVPPLLQRFPALAGFRKTLVFAHYRLSTRAIAALTSMEAQRRLLARSGGFTPPETAFTDAQLSALTEPALPWTAPAGDAGRARLKEAVRTFFNTTHARRVLAAYAALCRRDGLADPQFPWGDLALDYCRAAGWGDMLQEYLQCLNKLEPAAPGAKNAAILLDSLCAALDWTDADRTQVLVLPHWGGEAHPGGYPCTFGERYTPDYSDKGAHDQPARDKLGKRITSKRLEFLMKRFQSPFCPFVLAASETAQEGVNLHNYCQTIFHWSVPSTLNSLIQEEGRVDRRASLTLRRQMAWLYRAAVSGSGPEAAPPSLTDLFQYRAAELCAACGVPPEALRNLEARGLFPMWYLPQPPDGFRPP